MGDVSSLIDVIQITRENASCLNRVAVDVFDAEPASAYLEAYLSVSNHALFAAIADSVVVGQVRGILHLQPDLPTELYIDNLGVTPELKRQGVGTRLIRALMDWGRDNGCQTFWLGTETDNEEARAFYETCGFEDRTIAYYFTNPPSSDRF